jgi:hypothetical protein
VSFRSAEESLPPKRITVPEEDEDDELELDVDEELELDVDEELELDVDEELELDVDEELELDVVVEPELPELDVVLDPPAALRSRVPAAHAQSRAAVMTRSVFMSPLLIARTQSVNGTRRVRKTTGWSHLAATREAHVSARGPARQ